ncbi:MAG: FAD:protein FMN transferase [Pseudomonadota bacterium]
MPRLPLLLLPMLLLLSACDSPPQSHTSRSSAFEQPLTLTLLGTSEQHAREAAEVALEDLHFIAEVSHPWRPGPLGRSNQMFGLAGEFSANPSIMPMLERAAELEQLSHGYYAPALGKLNALWGFHSDLPTGPIPAEEEIQAILEAEPTLDAIHREGITMRSDNPAVQVDFGPFARGYAIDTARDRLIEEGIETALLDNDNFIATVGEGWQFSLGNNGMLPLQAGEAAVTLDTTEYRLDDGQLPYHPHLNPQSGYPGRGIERVTVLHPSAGTAAALAHALLAGGEAMLPQQLQRLPLEHALIQTNDGRSITTPALEQRLRAVRN